MKDLFETGNWTVEEQHPEPPALWRLAQLIFDRTPPFHHCNGEAISIPFDRWRKETQAFFLRLAEDAPEGLTAHKDTLYVGGHGDTTRQTEEPGDAPVARAVRRW